MNAPAEKLTQDVKVLATDLQELLKATASQTGDRISAARTRVEPARHDGLQRAHNGRRGDDGIDAFVRARSVRSFAENVDRK